MNKTKNQRQQKQYFLNIANNFDCLRVIDIQEHAKTDSALDILNHFKSRSQLIYSQP